MAGEPVVQSLGRDAASAASSVAVSTAAAASPLTPAEVLAAIPHGAPFRFVDDILEVDDDHIVASCRFDANADFYRGHFPGNPITPGVLLLEAMAQAGVVAHGIYLLGRPALEASRGMLTLFTQAEAEFLGIVRPGERLLVTARKLTFRHRLLRSKVTMTREDGTVVCEATLTGMGTRKSGTGTEFTRSANSGPVPDFSGDR
jgi:3-hydroxyacyl-[acyl-carrier-protein] dehydratase